MNDVISRQDVINSFLMDDDGTAWSMDDIVYRLEQFPSAQPERKKGKWIGMSTGTCSVCGHYGCAPDIWDGCEDGEFCPNCGADLSEDESEGGDQDD